MRIDFRARLYEANTGNDIHLCKVIEEGEAFCSMFHRGLRVVGETWSGHVEHVDVFLKSRSLDVYLCDEQIVPEMSDGSLEDVVKEWMEDGWQREYEAPDDEEDEGPCVQQEPDQWELDVMRQQFVTTDNPFLSGVTTASKIDALTPGVGTLFNELRVASVGVVHIPSGTRFSITSLEDWGRKLEVMRRKETEYLEGEDADESSD